MISFLDPYLSMSKIQEMRLQAWSVHALVEARFFGKEYYHGKQASDRIDTLADARRARRERRKK